MRRFLPLLAAGLLAFHPGFVTAWTAQIPDLFPNHIEEDWELVIGEPNPTRCGPQITTTMSPLGDNNVNFVTFNINYREDRFRVGGMELQAWAGRKLIVKDADREPILSTAGERITWTQSMTVKDGLVNYSIEDGRSQTFGDFGLGTNLILEYPTAIADLRAYLPDVTVANSGAGWQSNRVNSMRLLRVRYYNGDTLLLTDETPRDVIASR